MSENLSVRAVERAVLLDDLHIRSDGSGRVVEAYAAVFNRKTEIYDQDGHYDEDINPKAFNRTIAHKGLNFGVLFNHARTVDGEPNPMATMPIGVPLEVVADERGVFTATRYLDNPLADYALDAIKQGALRAQSFSGRFLKSTRTYPNGRSKGSRAQITRHEIDMREYGPAVFAAYPDAAILGTRTLQLAVRALLALPEQERLQWVQQFETAPTPADSGAVPGTPTGGRATEDASKHHRDQIAAKIAAFRTSH